MILVVAAMESEICSIQKHPLSGIDFLITGVGKVNAAMKLTDYLTKHHVSAIYNLGFAGASNHYQTRDIVLIKESSYHDFDLSMFGYDKGQVPHYPSFFQTDDHLYHEVSNKLEHIKTGQLYTGDQFVTGHINHPMILDMEGTALYQVAYTYQIPIVSIKVISDVIGMDNHLENYKAFEAEEGSNILLDVYLKLFKKD